MIVLLTAGALCATGFESNAKAKMGKGWNLGNSLEACESATQADETLWENPNTTEVLIKTVKAAGFKMIRLLCARSEDIQNQGNLARACQRGCRLVCQRRVVYDRKHPLGQWLVRGTLSVSG
jgi:hypothetical protein